MSLGVRGRSAKELSMTHDTIPFRIMSIQEKEISSTSASDMPIVQVARQETVVFDERALYEPEQGQAMTLHEFIRTMNQLGVLEDKNDRSNATSESLKVELTQELQKVEENLRKTGQLAEQIRHRRGYLIRHTPEIHYSMICRCFPTKSM